MSEKRVMVNSGAILTARELEEYLEKIASTHNLVAKSNKETYPIPRLLDNYKAIKDIYEMLNEHVKQGISIHPAGEWILDNFYIIEETVKSIRQELPLKKYRKFVGLKNESYSGFARVYALATEIVNYTDNKIETENLERYLSAYQAKKTLNMDEIWDIGIFLQIAIIENIRQICERIYVSQLEKFKVEIIIENLIENKKTSNFRAFKMNRKQKMFSDMKNPFIEYMSYKLKKYGKKTEKYLEVLEEVVEKTGSTVSDVIKKEHFDIALRRVSIGNAIISIKKIQRINFLEIFEKINGVEEILKLDPAGVYEKMDNKTKDYYRQTIKQIAENSKISEVYVAKKLLELAKEQEGKKGHIGYYLFGKNKEILYKKIGCKVKNEMEKSKKAKYYITMIGVFTFVISLILVLNLIDKIPCIWVIIAFFTLLIPVSEFVIQIFQYVLSKFVKPKLIPKIDFSNGIDKENATMVIIPTILKSKEKVRELMRKLEVFYLANKSDNLYFCLLGDASESDKETEDFDQEIIDEGIKQVKRLNELYAKNSASNVQNELYTRDQVTNMRNEQIFNFVYRKRKWNEKQGKYLGWERKRGAISEFVEFLLGNMSEKEIRDKYHINTIAHQRVGSVPKKDRPQMEQNITNVPKKGRPQMEQIPVPKWNKCRFTTLISKH